MQPKPVGVMKALLKKTIDDEVSVERPAGKAIFIVLNVSYYQPTD